ncbi:hypothetical protein FA13DRAFT_199886 [Coprinellus micaceus]|uniref:Uncharacterized protein n=1 Tax=Coprinellus micaceus TaxID=71717 RepID=A0A4Y7SG95_COPMI|nr:hypothetical protein FA13DRAFT_199886 [Coprinellus micaceus]
MMLPGLSRRLHAMYASIRVSSSANETLIAIALVPNSTIWRWTAWMDGQASNERSEGVGGLGWLRARGAALTSPACSLSSALRRASPCALGLLTLRGFLGISTCEIVPGSPTASISHRSSTAQHQVWSPGDVLAIGCDQNDYIAHSFGPSHRRPRSVADVWTIPLSLRDRETDGIRASRRLRREGVPGTDFGTGALPTSRPRCHVLLVLLTAHNFLPAVTNS